MAFTTILVNIVTFPQDALQIQGSQWQIIQSSQFLTKKNKKKNTCILFIFDITHNSFYYHIYPLQIFVFYCCFVLYFCHQSFSPYHFWAKIFFFFLSFQSASQLTLFHLLNIILLLTFSFSSIYHKL